MGDISKVYTSVTVTVSEKQSSHGLLTTSLHSPLIVLPSPFGIVRQSSLPGDFAFLVRELTCIYVIL